LIHKVTGSKFVFLIALIPLLSLPAFCKEPLPTCDSAKAAQSFNETDYKQAEMRAYMQAVRRNIQAHWYAVLPAEAESPSFKRGCLAIGFAISRDGHVAKMSYESTSGDEALDRAAWDGIAYAAPFPALPSGFERDHVDLHFHFFYNPAPKEALQFFQATDMPADDALVVSRARSLIAAKDYTVAPMLIHAVPPEFPKKLRRKKWQGEIVLRMTIGKDGTVEDVSVESGDSEIVGPALDAARQWQYLPAIQKGQLIQGQTDAVIHYDLSKGASQPKPGPAVPLTPSEDLLKEISWGELFRSGLGTGVNPPRAVFAPNAQYSEMARKNKLNGHLTLGLVVGADGLPRCVWSIQPLGDGLDENAIETVKQWRFSPATKDGKPVPSVISVEMTFRIS